MVAHEHYKTLRHPAAPLLVVVFCTGFVAGALAFYFLSTM